MYDEDAQIEALRRWWDQNWKALVAGLVIGLVGLAGWQWWTHHQARHRLQAAQTYDRLSKAMTGSQDADVKTLAEALTRSYDDTPYAGMAELKLAQADVSNGRFKDAAGRLRWVVTHAEDRGVRAIAQLRLASVLWQLDQPNAALKQLQQPPEVFQGMFAALRGDILASRHKDAEAQQAYRQALQSLPSGTAEAQALQDKLTNLAGAQGAGQAPAAPATSSKIEAGPS